MVAQALELGILPWQAARLQPAEIQALAEAQAKRRRRDLRALAIVFAALINRIPLVGEAAKLKPTELAEVMEAFGDGDDEVAE